MPEALLIILQFILSVAASMFAFLEHVGVARIMT